MLSTYEDRIKELEDEMQAYKDTILIKDQEIESLNTQLIEQDTTIGELRAALKYLGSTKENQIPKIVVDHQLLTFLNEKQERVTGWALNTKGEFKYVYSMYGPAGLQRQKVLKDSFRNIISNIVPIQFCSDVNMLLQPNPLSSEEYSELVALPLEQRLERLETIKNKISISDTNLLRKGMASHVRDILLKDMREPLLKIHTDLRE